MKRKKAPTIIIVLLLIAGSLVLSYPTISDWQARQKHVEQVSFYETEVVNLDPALRDAEWQKAVVYNENLAGEPVKDPFVVGSGMALPDNYMQVLNVEGSTMGFIEIPSIKVKLPIYHGVSDEVLFKGVGHMEGTALPIGGARNHTLLTGHTGLPESRLFTDLIELELGDKFYLNVLGKELVYQVDQIRIIEPHDVGELVAAVENDFVTLITCTPYGVNSHRLLVRGVRVNQLSKAVQITTTESKLFLILLWIGIGAAFFFFILYVGKTKRMEKRERIIRHYQKQRG